MFGNLCLLAFGLGADAFAVSACKGLACPKVTLREAGIVAAWFGGFQAAMLLGGLWLGVLFGGVVQSLDHWIAFTLLALIGLNMVDEAIRGESQCRGALDAGDMLVLAVATSIDAMAAGVTLVWQDAPHAVAVGVVGVAAAAMSAVGIFLGRSVGSLLGRWAQLAGGACLFWIGLKILLTHTGII